MTSAEAKKIGSRQGLICSGLGVLIAELIMASFFSADENFFTALLWFTSESYKLNLLVGVSILLLCGHFFGQMAGRAIIIKNKNAVAIGCLCGMAVLLTTAFFSGWTGFFQEGIDNFGTNDNPFTDYIVKPFFWVTLFGTLPALLVGIWLGRQIKRKARKHTIRPITAS